MSTMSLLQRFYLLTYLLTCLLNILPVRAEAGLGTQASVARHQ